MCVFVGWGGRSSPLDKSVFCWAQQGPDYGYVGFRDPNMPNLDKGILNANGDFETWGKRNVLGTISIHFDDLFILRFDSFDVYISERSKGTLVWVDMEKTNRPI